MLFNKIEEHFLILKIRNDIIKTQADVAKLVDALALGASGATLESSSLSVRTSLCLASFNILNRKLSLYLLVG